MSQEYLNTAPDYVSLNRNTWDSIAEINAKSQMYNLRAFLESSSHVSTAVNYDIPRLPPLQGKHVLHLQSHIGVDALSLARLGAASVTCLDFSAESLRIAHEFAASCADTGGDRLFFVHAEAYSAADPGTYSHTVNIRGEKMNPPPRLPGDFDIVYSSIGSLVWLPSVAKWGHVVSVALKKGGILFIRDGHPMLYTIDDAAVPAGNNPNELKIKYQYFEDESQAHTVLESSNPYADVAEEVKDKAYRPRKTVEFYHGLGETVMALLNAGMRLKLLEEHLEVPFEAISGRMEKVSEGEWRLSDNPKRCPGTFTIVAEKE